MQTNSHMNSPYEQLMADDLTTKLTDKQLLQAQDISHVETHNKHISAMYLNEIYCDRYLMVTAERVDQNGNTTKYLERVPVNACILASRCQYFHSMFFSRFSESSKTEIVLPHFKAEPFKRVLQYIYHGKLFIYGLNVELTIDILELAQYFCFDQLLADLVDYLRSSLTLQNVWIMERASRKYHLPNLYRACVMFIDTNAQLIVANSFGTIEFKNEPKIENGNNVIFDTITEVIIDTDVLIDTISRNSFYAEEEQILRAVCDWIKKKRNGDSSSIDDHLLKQILSCVRFSLIKTKVSENILKEFGIKGKLETSAEPRGCLLLNQNVATKQFNVMVSKGRKRSKMINESNRWYNRRTNCTSHSIETCGETQIFVTLSKQFILNHIRMCLFDASLYSYSYKIEVSVDKKIWTIVVDYSKYLCHSWQHLFFKPLSVKYIRIIGNRSVLLDEGSKNEFNVLHFECMYCTVDVVVQNTLVIPKQNVWKPDVKPFQRCERKYLEILPTYPKMQEKDGRIVPNVRIPFEKGSVCWFINNTIYFQLSQPFMIDSIGFQLSSNQNNSKIFPNIVFTYSMEVSTDFQNWIPVQCNKSIQIKDIATEILRFQPFPIVFIRLMSSNFLFVTLTSFECPIIGDNPPITYAI